LLYDFQVKTKERLENTNDYRVRLCSSRDGTMTITCHVLLDTIAESMKSSRIFRCILDSENVINLRSVHLYHKTTERSLYDNARAKHKCLIDDNFDAPLDVLLVNEFGHLTEFCIGNLVVELSDKTNEEEVEEEIVESDDNGITIRGQVPLESFENCCEDLWPLPSPGFSFFTPPISSGLLPGVLRTRLLHLGKVKTRIIKISELESCKRIWLINSVRGWVKVTVKNSVGYIVDKNVKKL
jgi:para-aminobenzoate synthetase/4-amino-4-deoxychorismate lyase